MTDTPDDRVEQEQVELVAEWFIQQWEMLGPCSRRGFSSITFLYSVAEYIQTLEKPAFIYHFGDYDLWGQNAADKIEEELRRYAPGAEIHFRKVAVTPEQIAAWNLPSRPTRRAEDG